MHVTDLGGGAHKLLRVVLVLLARPVRASQERVHLREVHEYLRRSALQGRRFAFQYQYLMRNGVRLSSCRGGPGRVGKRPGDGRVRNPVSQLGATAEPMGREVGEGPARLGRGKERERANVLYAPMLEATNASVRCHLSPRAHVRRLKPIHCERRPDRLVRARAHACERMRAPSSRLTVRRVFTVEEQQRHGVCVTRPAAQAFQQLPAGATGHYQTSSRRGDLPQRRDVERDEESTSETIYPKRTSWHRREPK